MGKGSKHRKRHKQKKRAKQFIQLTQGISGNIQNLHMNHLENTEAVEKTSEAIGNTNKQEVKMRDYSNKALKYFRGSVWDYVDDGNIQKSQGVQSGSRPALIVSDNIGNYSNDSVIVLFISSQAIKGSRSVNVLFENDIGEQNVVLCNQTKTVSKRSLTKFRWRMTEETMEEVDNAFALATGLSGRLQQNISVETLENTVKSIIDKFEVKHQAEQEIQEDITKQQVEKIATQLEEMFTKVLLPIHREIESAPVLTAYSKAKQAFTGGDDIDDGEDSDGLGTTEVKTEGKAEGKAEGKEEGTTSTKTKKPYGYWTPERMEQFIKDKEVLTLSEMVDKWNMKSGKAVYQNYHNFKSKLKGGRLKGGGVNE